MIGNQNHSVAHLLSGLYGIANNEPMAPATPPVWRQRGVAGVIRTGKMRRKCCEIERFEVVTSCTMSGSSAESWRSEGGCLGGGWRRPDTKPMKSMVSSSTPFLSWMPGAAQGRSGVWSWLRGGGVGARRMLYAVCTDITSIYRCLFPLCTQPSSDPVVLHEETERRSRSKTAW